MKTIEELRAMLAAVIANFQAYDGRDSFSEEEIETINALHSEMADLEKTIATREKLEAVKAVSAKPAPRATKPAPVVTPKKVESFENAGNFYKAVARSTNGRTDQRLQVSNTAQERFGEDGGFLIPSDFRSEIQSVIEGDGSLLAETRQFKTSSNHLVLPVSETAPWDGSGIQAFWEGEGDTYKGSKPQFRQANLRLNKLTAIVRVSEELLEDAPALESFIKMETPKVFTHKINTAIINGSGNGQPEGFLKSDFRVKVSKEVGQASDSVVTENIINMHSRMLPSSMPKATWLINPQVMPIIRMLKFDKDANSPVPMFMPPTGLEAAPYGTLMGRPIKLMMGGVSELGVEGDINFVDLNHYISAVKTTGVNAQVSTHVYFDTADTAFRFSLRVAGQIPYSKPVKTENGDFEMSGIVTLEDR